MSIYPISCADVEDALSVKKIENGTLEVGVHIADVSHFALSPNHPAGEAKDGSSVSFSPPLMGDLSPDMESPPRQKSPPAHSPGKFKRPGVYANS